MDRRSHIGRSTIIWCFFQNLFAYRETHRQIIEFEFNSIEKLQINIFLSIFWRFLGDTWLIEVEFFTNDWMYPKIHQRIYIFRSKPIWLWAVWGQEIIKKKIFFLKKLRKKIFFLNIHIYEKKIIIIYSHTQVTVMPQNNNRSISVLSIKHFFDFFINHKFSFFFISLFEYFIFEFFTDSS